MSETLSALKIVAQLTGTPSLDLSSGAGNAGVTSSSGSVGTTEKPSLTVGTSANQFNRIWSSESRALGSGGTEDIDLYDLGTIDVGAGAGLSTLGQAFANAELVALEIVNKSSSAGNLLVGGKGASTAWDALFNSVDTSVLLIPPNGGFLVWALNDPAYDVTDTTHHLLKLEASGGAVTYDIHAAFRDA